MDEPVKILVVDDVPDVAESLAGFLRVNGMDVRTAWNAHDALRCMDEFQPLCVMLDLSMPDMSGAELAHELRERYGSQIVLIAITGNADIDVVLAPEVRLVDHCMRKPLRIEELAMLLPLQRGTQEEPGSLFSV